MNPLSAVTKKSCSWAGLYLLPLALVLGQMAGTSIARPSPRPQPTSITGGHLLFTQYLDRTEGAFSLLVPKGWHTRGGLVRLTPGLANLVAGAKIDFTVQRPDRLAELRFFPRFHYYDYGPYSLYPLPEGSDYNGMTVRKVQTPEEFTLSVLLPRHRPEARAVRLIEAKPLGEAARLLNRACPNFPGMVRSWHKMSVVTVSYIENGRRFRERFGVDLYYLLMQRNQHTIWCNEISLSTRALETEFLQLESLLSISVASAQVNPRWLLEELKAQFRKGQLAVASMEEVFKIQTATVAARRAVQDQAAHEWSKHILGMEDYWDPRMNLEVRLPNHYRHVWADGQGTYLLTDSELLNPNEQLHGTWEPLRIVDR